MNRMIMAIISAAVIMNTKASDNGQTKEVEKYRIWLNSYIMTKTSFSAVGIHDIIERTGLDINAPWTIDADIEGKKKELTLLQLAQQNSNAIAVKYLLWRGAHDKDPARSAELLQTLGCIDYVKHVVIRTEPSEEYAFIESNTTKVTAAASAQPAQIIAVVSAPSSQPTQEPAQKSPEISGYMGSKRLKESPKSEDDDD